MSGKRTKVDSPDKKTKRQRSDVSQRKARNKNTECSIVKCSLKSFCQESASVLPWDSVLKDPNKAVAEAYILANLRVVRLCQTGRPIPVLDQEFYYQCLSVVSVGLKARKKVDDEDLRQSVELYKSWRDPNVSFASSAHISYVWFQNASSQMATNAFNHVVVNFYRRFQKYVKQRVDITGKERYKLLRDVLAPTYAGSDGCVLEFRRWIPRNAEGYVDKEKPHLILPVTYRFLQFIEQENYRKREGPRYEQLRSFSLLQLKRVFECSHFKMCKLGLYALLRRAGIQIPDIKRKEGQPCWNDVVDEWWHRLFKITKLETENRKFAGEISTDGKAVSIVLRKLKQPEPEKSPSLKKDPKTYNFGEAWDLDPGQRDLFVATNNFDETIACSMREFYEDAKYTSSNKTTRYWIDHNPKILEAIRNMPSEVGSVREDLESTTRPLAGLSHGEAVSETQVQTIHLHEKKASNAVCEVDYESWSEHSHWVWGLECNRLLRLPQEVPSRSSKTIGERVEALLHRRLRSRVSYKQTTRGLPSRADVSVCSVHVQGRHRSSRQDLQCTPLSIQWLLRYDCESRPERVQEHPPPDSASFSGSRPTPSVLLTNVV